MSRSASACIRVLAALVASVTCWPTTIAAKSLSPAPRAEPMPAALQIQDDAISVSFSETPLREVLFVFAEFTGYSIVAGEDVTGLVSAEIRNQPWRPALTTLLQAHGMVTRETETGIIRVESARRLADREAFAPVATRTFSLDYLEAEEIEQPVAALLTERGRVSFGATANTVVVSDIPRVLDGVAELIRTLDVRVPQIDISAKIIFVNRTDLEAFGITYDLKDVGGNQLNLLTPGVADRNGNGIIELPDEQVDRGTDVISLGGNSLAALGNATNRIASPTLSLLTSLVMGRRTLLTFIDALDSFQLTDVEAQPSLRVMNNRTARIVVGEETPVRVLDAGTQLQAGADAGGSSVPLATVDYKETGVILEVTPRVTSGNEILLALTAERSSADLAPSDIGVVFRRQRAQSQVLLEDGETVVIGGLTVAEKGEVVSGIPVLMSIPLLGRLFRTRGESFVRRDLLILVTPEVVSPSGQ